MTPYLPEYRYAKCTGTALDGQCNSVGCPSSGTGGGSTSTDDLISNPGDNLIDSSSPPSSSDGDGGLIKRATLTCSSTEVCYDDDGSLRCYDLATGDYRTDTGETGNALTGDESSSSSSATRSATRTSSSTSTSTQTSTRSGSSAASSATVTGTSDVGRNVVGWIGMGVVVGAVLV